jgi:YD repeat-containing protein
LQTLSRQFISAGGQVSDTKAYFYLTGLTYTTSPTMGTAGTNYYQMDYGYNKRGNIKRVQSPTGTITRHVYDAPGRLSSIWVGRDDTPTSVLWSPTNTEGTDLVKVSENVYDDGGVGDGNLTQVTQLSRAKF